MPSSKTATTPNRLWQIARQIQILGATPENVHARSDFDRWLKGDPSLDAIRDPRVRTTAAWLHVLMLEVPQAIDSLGPYASLDGSGRIQLTDHFDSLARESAFEAAFLASAAVNCQYRLQSDLRRALQLSERAEELFASAAEPAAAEDAVSARLSRLENQIWWSRIEYRLRQTTQAELRLRDTIRQLEGLYEFEFESELDDVPPQHILEAIDRVLAIALELWAAFLWNNGKLD